MGFNVLLVNPNRFRDPPVIPIGLEYITTALEKYHHNVNILDLCFCESPKEQLTKTLSKRSYDIVGFSIRNIDSLGYFNNKFFLPSIKPLVQCVKKQNIPVILGGSGFSAMPYKILDYFDADYGIVGPGEIIFPRFLELLRSEKKVKKIHNGWHYGSDVELVHLRGHKIHYSQYLSGDATIGFETHKGCTSQYPFCINAGTITIYKKIPYIIEELKYIVNQGYTHFQLCDNEFNSDLNFSIKFCKALIEANFPLKWSLCIKPQPYSEELFKQLHGAKVYKISIDITSDKRIQELNNYNYNDLRNVIEYCTKYQFELVINLLVGYPHESYESIKKMIDFFKSHRPTSVTVDSYFRVYDNTVLADLIKNDPSLQINLIKPYSEKLNFLEPVYYNQISQDLLEDLISEDELFRIAWFNTGLNSKRIE
ncbi:MAG: B12-binding domain-containing radical SAM protein [Promethearchaeota archaeon]